jgi:hypothetical protein
MHFVERTYPGLFETARAVLPQGWRAQVDAAERWAADQAIDQKRADAIALLRSLAEQPELPPVEGSALAPFRITEAWAADLDASGLYAIDGQRSTARQP